MALKQRAEVRRQIGMLRQLLERQMELTGQDPISGGRAGQEAGAEHAATGAPAVLTAPAEGAAAPPQSPHADGTGSLQAPCVYTTACMCAGKSQKPSLGCRMTRACVLSAASGGEAPPPAAPAAAPAGGPPPHMQAGAGDGAPSAVAMPPPGAAAAAPGKGARLAPEAEARLLAFFALQDTLTREDARMLAGQVGA